MHATRGRGSALVEQELEHLYARTPARASPARAQLRVLRAVC
jgi:hypothetical protein